MVGERKRPKGYDKDRMLEVFERHFAETGEVFFPVEEVEVVRGTVRARDGLHWMHEEELKELKAGRSPCFFMREYRSGEWGTLMAMGGAKDVRERMLCYLDAFVHEVREHLRPVRREFPRKVGVVLDRIHWTCVGEVGYDAHCKYFIPWDTGLYCLGDLEEDVRNLGSLDDLMKLAVKVAVRGLGGRYRFVVIKTLANPEMVAAKRAEAGPVLELAVNFYRSGAMEDACECAGRAVELLTEARRLGV